MSTLVGAFGTGHILMSRGSAGEAGERAYRGMREVGRRVAALKPDVLVIVSSDHFYNLHGLESNAFLLGTAETFDSFGDMDIPVQRLAGSPGLAQRIMDATRAKNFPLVALDDSYQPDHGVLLPYLMAGLDTQVLPVITNLGAETLPSMQQGWDLGEIVRQAIDADSGQQRVVILGTGGLSHWLGVPEMGRVNPDFDQEVLGTLIQGNGHRLAGWSSAQIAENGGNGGLEIINWAVMAGACPGAKGEQIYYEALPEWVTGLGGIELFVEKNHVR